MFFCDDFRKLAFYTIMPTLSEEEILIKGVGVRESREGALLKSQGVFA